jgi:hypothetical protein
MSLKKFITSPTISGVLIGLVTLAAVMVVAIWFPGIGDGFGRHKTLLKATWFTVALFAICVYRLWSWRHRNSFSFWTSMCVLFLLHLLGVLLYTILVQPILGWQWIILLVLETFVIVSLVDWSTARFGHLGRHKLRGSPHDNS